MKKFEVLGTGCTKCVKTAELIKSIAAECGVEVQVVKETIAPLQSHIINNVGVLLGACKTVLLRRHKNENTASSVLSHRRR